MRISGAARKSRPSQPAPADVTALWDKLLTDHDEVVYIPISSGLSGSCQAAMALAEDAPYAGRVFVVDNGRVATALHVTVLDALRLRDAGDDAATIKRKLEPFARTCASTSRWRRWSI